MIITNADLTHALVPQAPQSTLEGLWQGQMAQTEMVFLDHLNEVQASSDSANSKREDLKERLRVIQERAEAQSQASNAEIVSLKVNAQEAKAKIDQLKNQIASKSQAEASIQKEKATVISSADAARARDLAKRQDLAYYSQTIECKQQISHLSRKLRNW